jgi:hypothetical protein
MTYPIFPIKTESACFLKWSWSTIFFDSGTSASCHRTQKYKIDPDQFDQFHNLPDKLVARQLMIDGEWPKAGCRQYCQQVEEAGGVSDRQFTLNQLSNPDLVPPELLKDSTKLEVTPTILEVYFKNTCNQACVYCGPAYSSLWEEENRKFKHDFYDTEEKFSVRNLIENPDYDRMVADFWKYLASDNRYLTLRRYHILGGEPFLLSELDDSIEFWNTHPNPDLTFSVVSNLNIPTDRFERYIKQFEKLVLTNKIWKLQLTASLDCWGPVQEYVRYGLDLERWQRNFELLLNKPWISLSINSAISALTIKEMFPLMEKINYWNTKQTLSAGRWTTELINHSYNTSSQYDNIYMFGPGVFDNDIKQIINIMPEDTEIQRGRKDMMNGILKRLQASPRDEIKIEKLREYLTILDQRRNTVWQDKFPWLV